MVDRAAIPAVAACLAGLTAAPVIADDKLVTRIPLKVQFPLWLALLAIVLTGLTLMLMIMLSGRYVRRLARHRVTRRPVDEDAWYKKPIVPPPTEEETGP